MKFESIPLNDAYLIDLDKIEDERGFFARAFCEKEFSSAGLSTNIVQINNSEAVYKGTLRGLHYQAHPASETKMVRCIRGSVYDVILDVRPESPTFGESYGTLLSSDNRRMLYVPKGFAHGFITMEDNSEVIYLVDQFYSPEYEKGIRWNDPKFNISWPLEPTVISDKDKNHPDFVL